MVTKKTTRKIDREPERPWFLGVVAVQSSQDRMNLFASRVTFDTGFLSPDPPLTQAEMQPVAYAAKMALIKVLLKRKTHRPQARALRAAAEADDAAGEEG